MLSESDESTYTVHEVHDKDGDGVAQSVEGQEGEGRSSPLARYYRLGTRERHAFDEHMRQLREHATAVERERQFRLAHPFQPTVSASFAAADDAPIQEAQVPRQSNLAPPVASDPAPSSSPSGVRPVFDRLAAQALQLEMRRRHREEQRRRAEAAALRGAFQPQINHTASIYAERLQHLDSVPVEQRLLHYGEYVARERQRKQELNELEKKMSWQSEQAFLVGAGAARTHAPEERRRQQEEFQERNARFLKERAKHREFAQAAAAEAFPFQPKISATSAALDEARQRLANNIGIGASSRLLNRSVDTAALSISKTSTKAGHRSDALYALAVNRQRHKQHNPDHNDPSRVSTVDLVGSGKGVADRSTTHQPLTNPTSDKWIVRGAHGPFFQESFVRRQALYEEVKREEAALRAIATEAPERNSGRSVAHKVSAQELSQRLYYSAKKASEAAERRRKTLVNAHECPFRPQLSPGTKCVLQRMPSRDDDVVKRLTTQRGRSAPHSVRTAVAEEFYARGPAARRCLQGHARSPSEQRKNETKSPTEVAAESAEKKTPPLTASLSPKAGDMRADGADDGLPEQQRKQHRCTLTRDQADHFYERQMAALQRRQDLMKERKEGEIVQELVECTFRPRTNTDRHVRVDGGTASAACSTKSVNHVTGVSEYLERQALARVRKAEHDELLRTVGLPRNKCAGSKGASSGSTILSPFKFQTEMRRPRPSCSPTRASISPHEAKQPLDTAPCSVAALTTAERALHEAIEGSHGYPRATSQAPLCPLPGYVQGEGDAKCFDDPYEGLADGWEVEESTPSVSPAGLSAERKRRDDAAVLGSGDQRPSLFSLISPNTFSGRNLGSALYDTGNGKASSVGPDLALQEPSPSALKGAMPQRTATAKRHRQHRSVSFVERTDEALPAGAAHRARRSFADPAHLAFLHGQL
ncbi:hypothetical protein LSCM4_00515 [Leishmania orientalis]|uniref:200 kDa antigen p200 n=1 Tax=Leishmania orientalis TaxID=2249476 RepID=A0A836GJL9_9TRYP|nr:hypothetical protein LSCM4_00515 [Leishmania orientalis]